MCLYPLLSSGNTVGTGLVVKEKDRHTPGYSHRMSSTQLLDLEAMTPLCGVSRAPPGGEREPNEQNLLGMAMSCPRIKGSRSLVISSTD